MDINELLKFVATVLASIGGAGVIFFKLSSYLGRIWAERLASEQRFEFAKELEKIKSEFQLKIDIDRETYLSDLRRAEEKFRNELQMERDRHISEIRKKEQEFLLDLEDRKQKSREAWSFKKAMSAKMERFNHSVKHAVEETSEGATSTLIKVRAEIRELARDHVYLFGEEGAKFKERTYRYTDLAVLAGSRKFDPNAYSKSAKQLGELLEKHCG